ncbi:MAG: peptidase M3 [Candidatus Marinimicrobia bacterium]|nr:peptidase M3 [Candidatus Neomarinimicrobiota bacterium]
MMKNFLTLSVAGLLFLMSCAQQSSNPFYAEYDTPYQTPPFEQINTEHYMPAFEKGMAEQQAEVEAIATSPDEPTFENTLVAMEESGELLNRVSNVFFNLTGANTSDELQEIYKEVAPKLSRHYDNIYLNEDLFSRVKTIYENQDQFDLDREQQKLLEDYYKDFVRGGANLSDADKKEFRKINEELSSLSVQFDENILKENNKFELVIDDEADLAGLTENVISGAAETAKERGHEGKWVFTLHKPSLIPFLQYSEKRDLREKMFKGYINRGDNGGELDNNDILAKMAALRVERANLLGFDTHAHYVLAENMAKNPDNVYELLDKLWTPALERAKAERDEMQAMIDREGGGFQLQPWDWWFYAEKLKKEKYALDDEILRPYFKLENVQMGIFDVANQLYGITFEERHDIPVYHPDVQVFEVKEADGSHLGIFYVDYFPRASKQGGAWMNSYRKQSNVNGDAKTPVITNVCNFSKPTGDKPALLSFDEVSTMFHEFGHAMHGMLSNCTYPSLSGTSVPRDFVELPSQIMENWASEPAVMKSYAKHYETGEPIPDELIEKIRRSRHFNQGFATVEYLAASYLDMDWHTMTEPQTVNVDSFENASMDKIGLIPEIVVRYRSPYFAHIFAGGYSSGYYSYIWAEVLDADAFQAFKDNGLFDRETANAFREEILAAGGTDEPMEMYKRFRGSEPEIQPLLERRGLN